MSKRQQKDINDELFAIVRDLLEDFKAGNVEFDYAHARTMELILEPESVRLEINGESF